MAEANSTTATPNRRQRRAAAKAVDQAPAAPAAAAPIPTLQIAADDPKLLRFQQGAAQMRKALKDLGRSDDEIATAVKELGAKCGIDEVYYVGSWTPYGGATTFEAYDQYRRSQEMAYEYDDLSWTLSNLIDNALTADDLSDQQKAQRIQSLAGEFATRAAVIKSEGGRAAQISGVAEEQAGPPAPLRSTFHAFKDDAGNWRWLAIHSNAYYDKHGEVFPEAAHKEYVARVDATKEFPELYDWHIPIGIAVYGGNDPLGRTGMGRADVVDYTDGFMISAGYFYPEFAYAAEWLAGQKDLGTSHGFDYFPADKGADGAYNRYWTFEVSPLPRARAANELTMFLPIDGTKEAIMNPTKRAQLVAVHGEEKVKAIESGIETLNKSLSDHGIGYKDIADAFESTPPAATSAAAATVPAATPAAGGTTPAPETEAMVKAMKEALTPMLQPITDQVGDLATRLEKLEKSDDARLASMFGPRVIPNPAMAPSMMASTLQDGRTTMVKAAAENYKEVADNIPEHLRYYFGHGVGGDATAIALQQAAAAAAAAAAAPPVTA